MGTTGGQLRFVLCLLVGWSALGPKTSAAGPFQLEPVASGSARPGGHALLIAANRPGAGTVTALEDAALVAGFAVRTLGFENVRLLVGAEAAGWKEAVEAAVQSPTGPVLVYVTGAVQCGSARDRNLPDLRALALRLKQAQTREALLLFDAECEADAPGPEGEGALAVIGALGRERPRVDGHGAFTFLLLHALRGPGDLDGDGIITTGELGSFLRNRWRRTERLTVSLGDQSGLPVVSGVIPPPPRTIDSTAAELTIEVDGADLSLYVDGIHRPGPGPVVVAGLAPGRHWISVTSAAGARSMHLELAAGERRSVHLEALPTPMVRIASLPVEAEVSLDGRSAGLAPVERVVGRGTHVLTLSHPAFKTLERPVEVWTGNERFSFELEPVDRLFAWSLLSPQLEFGMRVDPSLWLSVRVQALYPGWVPPDGFAEIYGGVSLLLRRPLWDPASELGGFEVYGGVVGEVVDLPLDLLVVGSVVGVAGQVRWVQLSVEVHTVYSEQGILAYVVPALSIRHVF